MEKILHLLYKNLLARWIRFRDRTKLWLNKYRYKLYMLGFLCLVIQTKDLQFTIGMDGYPIADFQAIRPFPRLMVQAISDATDDLIEGPISWKSLLTEEQAKPAKQSPKATPVELPAKGTERRSAQMDYVARFSKLAQIEMKKYGIPASITLAQGILESESGNSRLASRHNNHFGIKCHSKSCPRGHCVNYADDSPKDFFRQYGTAWESFRAHSEFLNRDRYRSLHKLRPTDYKGWARGLQKAGYATGNKYAEKLIRLIEDLKLYQYDKV
ncbi:MAG: glucosaminidase domain-containing protein [Saprospirales bacterium]|nr:glucosaminidase domain-containing protein [Saprospirales bacterium]